MYAYAVRNVNEAFSQGVDLLRLQGISEPSRNGPVLRFPGPVATTYTEPQERVLFDPYRDANPFFHLVEALWMVAGRDDLGDLTPYVSRMRDFSDDGQVLWGAYGKRWRNWFYTGPGRGTFFDQLDWVVRRLSRDPNDRRVVIQMWDPELDSERVDEGGKDVPCNLSALPSVYNGQLHLTVFCRSNDMVWGAYGANAVHFSFLLEYLAMRLGMQVGTYTQISNNFHGYSATMPSAHLVYERGDPYSLNQVQPFGLTTDLPNGILDAHLREDLAIFFEEGAYAASTAARWPFLRRVAVPMSLAHEHYRSRKEDRFSGTLEILERVEASDWRRAAVEWVQRRQQRVFNGDSSAEKGVAAE